MLVVPGRPPRRVDGALAGAQQRRLRLALAGGALPGRAPGPHGREQPVQGLRAAAVGRGTLASARPTRPVCGGHPSPACGTARVHALGWGHAEPTAPTCGAQSCSHKLGGAAKTARRGSAAHAKDGEGSAKGCVPSRTRPGLQRKEWPWGEADDRAEQGADGDATGGRLGRGGRRGPLRLALQHPAHAGEEGGSPVGKGPSSVTPVRGVLPALAARPPKKQRLVPGLRLKPAGTAPGRLGGTQSARCPRGRDRRAGVRRAREVRRGRGANPEMRPVRDGSGDAAPHAARRAPGARRAHAAGTGAPATCDGSAGARCVLEHQAQPWSVLEAHPPAVAPGTTAPGTGLRQHKPLRARTGPSCPRGGLVPPAQNPGAARARRALSVLGEGGQGQGLLRSGLGRRHWHERRQQEGQPLCPTETCSTVLGDGRRSPRVSWSPRQRGAGGHPGGH